MIELIIALILSYLVGGIPTSIIAGRILKGIDIRDHGSGNAGATNVYRVLGPVPAAVVVLIDAGKGIISVLLISTIVPQMLLNDPVGMKTICGMAAVIGHSFPLWAGFRGGKGVGTGAGVMFSLIPAETAILLAIFIIIVIITRYVSLGSISVAVLLPAFLIIEKYLLNRDISNILLVVSLFISVFIIFSHRSNIRRLMDGKENRIGGRVKD
jgi:glycerol-3-phosphate acyltransferase PlsY